MARDAVALVADLLWSLKGRGHKELTELGPLLGLAVPDDGTKAERLESAIVAIDPSNCRDILMRYLSRGLANPQQRNDIEDILWAGQGLPAISQRTRREIAAALPVPMFGDADGLMALLDRLFVLEDDTMWLTMTSKRTQVEQHLIRNDDWDALELFKQVGALTCSDRRFALFIEGLLSGRVNPDEPIQRATAAAITPVLTSAGLRLDESSGTDGYLAFTVVDAGGHRHPPQGIIFATLSKPDLRFTDLIDKLLEVRNLEQVLLYDEPIPAHGLRWADVQAWYASRTGLSSQDGKSALYQRLRASMPDGSPAQQAFFDEYHRAHAGRSSGDFPALLPEVWHHWDSQTLKQRGEHAFDQQRMDFLLLLPGRRRVVIEVDGRQHYDNPTATIRTLRGDRQLRLAGYEVYRFATNELEHSTAANVVGGFLAQLFNRLLP